MTNTMRFVKARRHLFGLQEIVLDVLIEAKKHTPLNQKPAMHPSEIAEKITVLKIEPFPPNTSHYSLVYGIIDSLHVEGRIARQDDGRIYLKDEL